MAYTGSVELISGIRQKNGQDFPLVDASAVRVDDNTRLDDALDSVDGKIAELPKTVDSNATNVDLDVTDRSGNVILRLQGGHIKTKEFDSQEIVGDVSDLDTAVTNLGNTTVSKNQGQQHAGEALIVGVDGIVTTGEAGVSVDTTLTESGKAADAKTVGDNFDTITDDIDSLSQEVSDSPTVKDSDAENIDLDITDSSGNVILRLKDGHVHTKNFSSDDITGATVDSDVSVLAQITDTNADLYITDNSGNGLARFSDGNIQTKNFNTDQSEYKKEFDYTNTSGTIAIQRFFPKGTTLAFHLVDVSTLGSATIANYKITYGYIDVLNVAHDIGSEYGYNYHVQKLPSDAKAVYAKYGTSLLWGETGSLAFSVFSEANYKRQPTIITVDVNGGRDYTSVRNAVDAAAPYASDYTPYEIHIYPGTYDILGDYTAEEIAEEDFVGLILTNGISLVGIGNRSEIILTAEMDKNIYNSQKRNYVSTLNIKGCVSIENLTINAKNIRYAVHDDMGTMRYKRNEHRFINVKFHGETMTTGDISYGAGGGAWKLVYAKDCDFSGEAHIHNSDNNVRPYFAYLENCSARKFSFADYSNVGTPSRFFLKNCKTTFIRIESVNYPHDQTLFLEGEGTCGAITYCESGYVYNLGDCVKIEGTEISAGKAVKLLKTYSSGNIGIATNLIDIYGISVGVMDGGTIIQTKGYINANILGLTGLSIGDYITIDNSGDVVVGELSNAIARVVFIDDYGLAHAKLML